MVQKQSKANIYSNYTDSDNFADEQSTNVCENLAHLTQSIKMQKQGYTLRSINKIHPRVIKKRSSNTQNAFFAKHTLSDIHISHILRPASCPQLTNWLRLPLAKSAAPHAYVLAQKQPHINVFCDTVREMCTVRRGSGDWLTDRSPFTSLVGRDALLPSGEME